jgi:hypothetical protein
VEILRGGLEERLHAEPHPFLAVGRRMRIARGPLRGLEGVLRRKKGRFRFVLSVELIHCSIAVDVDSADLQPVHESTTCQSGLQTSDSILTVADCVPSVLCEPSIKQTRRPSHRFGRVDTAPA